MGDTEYTWEEINKHSTAGDCVSTDSVLQQSYLIVWVVIKGKVYDVSDFAEDHPGGIQYLLVGTLLM